MDNRSNRKEEEEEEENENKNKNKNKRVAEGGGLKGKSCKGYLYYSSNLKSNGSNPRCIGIPRSLNQVPNYTVAQSEVEASKEKRSLVDFYYACAGYSVYISKDHSTENQVTKTQLPVCVGLELLVDRRVGSANTASAPAPVHGREGMDNNIVYALF
eukprot:XP_015583616.1 uncharacterized protein LOC8268606 isoform X1 [Ricinus communis]